MLKRARSSRNNLLRFIDGKGRVFDPNPVVTLNDTSLNDKSKPPDKAYSEVILRDLKKTGFIEGPFVTTKTTRKRVNRKNFDFRFKRPDRAFKEVMVYFRRPLDTMVRCAMTVKSGQHALWELRAVLGRKPAEQLIVAHHFLLSRNAGFEDGANALITADKNLNKGANEKVIRDVFVRRGILPNPKRHNKRAGTPFEDIPRRRKENDSWK